MVKLTEEQKKLLILMGQPDDGSKIHILDYDVLRIQSELVKLGFAYRYKGLDGKETHDLTDEGEHEYGELIGQHVS